MQIYVKGLRWMCLFAVVTVVQVTILNSSKCSFWAETWKAMTIGFPNRGRHPKVSDTKEQGENTLGSAIFKKTHLDPPFLRNLLFSFRATFGKYLGQSLWNTFFICSVFFFEDFCRRLPALKILIDSVHFRGDNDHLQHTHPILSWCHLYCSVDILMYSFP